MTALNFLQRLQDLENNVAGDESLLKDFEDALRFEDNPRRIARYKQDIEKLKVSITKHRQEYEDLSKYVKGNQPPEMISIENHLQEMNTKLNFLLNSQVAIYNNLSEMRQTLLARYDLSERKILEGATQQLNGRQLTITQTLLDALESSQVSELEAREILTILERHIPALPATQADIANIIKDPALDAKHKLKVSIPIIPFILDYEGELEIGTGFNINTAWQKVKSKLIKK